MRTGLVVFGEDWGGHPSSTQHIVRRLMAERPVIWVNSIGLRRPRFDLSDARRAARKIVRALARPAPMTKGDSRRSSEPQPAAVINPLAIPLPGNPMARRINGILLPRAIRAAMATAGIERPILWASLPTAVDVAGKLDERAVVYYCGDDFGGLAGVDHGPVLRLEAELANRADLILAASPALKARFEPDRTVLLPHGVDARLFGQPAARPADLPADGPIAGFYGSLSDWIDLPLLAETARRLPDWHFVLIGPVRTDLTPIRDLSNIRLLGERHHHDLPGYVQHWTASLLPFRDNAQIRACNPLKLREYFAAGTAVISTDFPALDGYRDLLTVIDSPAGFADALCAARREETERQARRRERVARETWEARAAEVSSLLDALS